MWVLAGIPGCIQTCGSELARDEGITFNIDVGRTIAIVGTPPGASSLPQWMVVCSLEGSL
ncbi:hypothetical protein D3C80_2069940 [compost metagenome]